MKISQQIKTTMENEGLDLAKWFSTNFDSLKEQPIELKTKSTLFKRFQKHLDRHIGRMEDNHLRGIICIRDKFGHHTGGRVHLVAGLEGPIIEAIQPLKVGEPIDYQKFSEYIIQSVEIVSQTARPKFGRIHIHPFFCNQETVKPLDILEFIQKSHGLQNELQQVADAEIFKFILKQNLDNSFWLGNINSDIINNLFGRK